MALRCSIGRSSLARLGSPLRSIGSLSDQATAQQAFGALGAGPSVFDAPPPPEKDFMDLPPIGTYRRGPRYEPLINVPPPEDPLLYFLTSMLMRHGERAKARRIVSKTLLYIFTFTRSPPLPILREAVLLASPAVRTSSFTHGAKQVQIPFALTEKQRTHYGIEWLIKAANARTGQRLAERLAREMVDVVQRTAAARGLQGANAPKFTGTLGKKAEVHTFAMVNRGGVRIDPAAARGGDGITTT
ncbi:ribosomal protein S7 domain-containing protein [Mycena rosella]|uniref:Ribosomal protein S7 domain-containing protein n=1 Tax=Mycena rosella TaxID=1033263 RepID=A0AAD7G963_MYCRO|nr:ribosomal protein S7 domain-containing protein [Mycena rosella]